MVSRTGQGRWMRGVLLVVLIAVVLGVVGLWGFGRRPGTPSSHNYQQVTEGMTQAEVEFLLGPHQGGRWAGKGWKPSYLKWFHDGDGFTIRLVFDLDGRVMSKERWGGRTLFEQLLGSLGLQKRQPPPPQAAPRAIPAP